MTIFRHPGNMHLFTDENYIKTIMRNLTANAINALNNDPEGNIWWKVFEGKGETYISIPDNGPEERRSKRNVGR